jgi:hypothetical protein
VRNISIIVDCIILLFCYLVLVGQVNVDFLPRLNVHGPFFALLVLQNLRSISESVIFSTCCVFLESFLLISFSEINKKAAPCLLLRSYTMPLSNTHRLRKVGIKLSCGAQSEKEFYICSFWLLYLCSRSNLKKSKNVYLCSLIV